MTTIGSLHVRRSAFARATPQRVWQEFTSFDRFAAWFGIGHTLHEFAPALGADVTLSVEVDGVLQRYGGQVTALDPGREISFAINWHDPSMAWPVPMFWTIRLTALYEGTTVEILHHGFERLGDSGGDALEGFESGWDNKHLIALRAIVEQ